MEDSTRDLLTKYVGKNYPDGGTVDHNQFKQSNERRLLKIHPKRAPIPRNTQKIVLVNGPIFFFLARMGGELIFTNRLPSFLAF